LLIIGYIVSTFGWDFLPIIMNLMDGNVSYQDIMQLAGYYGYI
jgi:hypothetical protein